MKTYTQSCPEPTRARVTGLRVTPEVFTAHDTLEVTFTLENISRTRLTGYTARMGYFHRGRFVALFDVGRGLAGMASRAVRSFTHEKIADGDAVDAFAAAMTRAGERARNGFVLALRITDSTLEEYEEYCPVDLACAFIDRRYGPSVEAFSLARGDGDALPMTAKLACAAQPPDGLFRCELRAAKGRAPGAEDAPFDLTDCTGVLLDGVEGDDTLFPGPCDAAWDWLFTLSYGDEYERGEAAFVLEQAFTNRHESGCETGGVRYGGFSRSTPGKPLFECDYPARFYAGLENVQAGIVEPAGLTGGNNCTDIPVRFAKPFAAGCVPVVVAGFVSVSTAGPFGRCCCAVLDGSVTNEGFTLRFYNGDSAGRNPAFTYIAIGVPEWI